MNKHLTQSELQRLPVSDRLRLIEDVWDSLADAPETVAVPDWHRGELDKRIAAHEQAPAATSPWTDVKAKIVEGLRSKK